MTIWSSEIKDLVKLCDSYKGQNPRLDKELERLIKTDDENIVLLYSRRCLEIIITELSERELKRPRGSEPLKGIIDKLHKEEKVPHNIVVSMQNLNSLSTFGTHPKDFDPRQVKPVLLDLATVLEWYMKYMGDRQSVIGEPGSIQEKRKETALHIKTRSKPERGIIIVTGILLAAAIIIVPLIVFNIIGLGKPVRAGSVESLVILPFSNYTGDETLETLVSGMHACLISDVKRLSGLRVINTTTSDVYKNAGKSIHEIADELKVEAAMEVSVLGIHDSILIQVSLINAFPEEEILWIEDFKEEKSKFLNLYNNITKKIADEVKIKLTPGEERLLAASRTVNPEALVAYMKGQFHWERIGKEDMDSALHYFQIAIDKAPDWADPYAGMAMTWSVIGGSAYGPLNEAYKKTTEYMNKALDLDPNSANSHYIKAVLTVWPGWDWETGEKEFLNTLELNPNDALARVYYAHLLMILRRMDEAIFQANLALALDPLRPLVLGFYARVMWYAGDFSAALKQSEKALSIDPDNNFALEAVTNACLRIGDTLKWYEKYRRRIYWSNEKYLVHMDSLFNKDGYFAVIKDRIKVNEEVYSRGGSISFTGQANRYLIMNEYDKAMDYYEKAYEEKLGNLAYLSLAVIDHPELKENQRYIALLKKMNLPLK
jgi:TolB-like protein